MSGIIEHAQNYFWNSFWRLVDVKEKKRGGWMDPSPQFDATLFVPPIDEQGNLVGYAEKANQVFRKFSQEYAQQLPEFFKTYAHAEFRIHSSSSRWEITVPEAALKEQFVDDAIRRGDLAIFALARLRFVFLEPGERGEKIVSCAWYLQGRLKKMLVNVHPEIIEINIRTIEQRFQKNCF